MMPEIFEKGGGVEEMQILAKSSSRWSTFFSFSFFPEYTSGKILPICRKSGQKANFSYYVGGWVLVGGRVGGTTQTCGSLNLEAAAGWTSPGLQSLDFAEYVKFHEFQ